MTRPLFAALLAGAALCLAAPARAVAPEDLKWDLTYWQSFERYPIPENEFMRMWPGSLRADRPIVAGMAAYAGAPIEAALLIEKPNGHDGDPVATWFVKTANGASVCTYARQAKGHCDPLDPARTERFIRDVLRFPALGPQKGMQLDEKGVDGQALGLNYLGFLSVYVDGVALQRPIGTAENMEAASGADPRAGRLDRAIAELVLTPEQARKRQARIDAEAHQQRLNEAAAAGDPGRLRKLLEPGAGPVPDLAQALALAAAKGHHRAVDFLLERGAKIDANESAALKEAVRANDEAMVRHLLERGARADPPSTGNAAIHQSALGLAVERRNAALARLLIERGAKADLAQSRSVLGTAVLTADPALVELVLGAGARADAGEAGDGATPLLLLVRQGESVQKDGRTEADRARIARLLVNAGANVNAITARCATAWSESVQRRATALGEVLQSLGADPALHERCLQKRQAAERGSTEDPEALARSAIANTVTNALRAHDYAKVDALYASVKDPRQVTPAGRSKLGIFYYTLRTYPASSRDPAYWRTMEAEAAAWKAKSPRSIPARMFEVYLHLRRTQAFRGSGYYNTLTAEERREVSAGASAADRVLSELWASMRTARDPEWYRTMINVLPYTSRYSPVVMMRHLNEGAERHPDYEDLYFTAAIYLTPDWLAQPDAREDVARHAKGGAGLYARVYWYLDQMSYHGKLFETGLADWPTMRTSFDSIVARHPDPWNLNAYAYFACKAGDYATLADLLKRIGGNVVASSWGDGGVDTYNGCETQAARGDAAERARFEAAQPMVRKKRMARVFFDFIRFGQRMRDSGNLDTSLAALRKAQDIDTDLERRPSMMAQYHTGMTLAKMGRHQEAVDAFTLGLRAQPDYEEAYWRRGQSYMALGRQEEARNDFGTGASYFRRRKPAEIAAIPEDARPGIREMLKQFREAGFATPDF